MGGLDQEGFFEDFESTAFPDLTGRSTQAKQTLRGHASSTHQLHISLAGLQNASAVCEASIDAIILAAWAKALAVFEGEHDVCIGSAQGPLGIGNVESEEGNFNRPAPIRANMRSPNSSVKLARDIDRQLKRDGASWDTTRTGQGESSSLFDTCVEFSASTMQQAAPSKTFLEGLVLFLRIQIIEGGERLQLFMHFERSLLLEQDTHHVISVFEDALTTIITNPESPAISVLPQQPKSIPSLVHASLDQLRSEHGPTIVDSIAYHSQHTPTAIALDFLDSKGLRVVWTYEELHEIATRIADTLIYEFDVGVEDSIPVCVPKSPAFYASILGVMMTGAAFTPFSNSPQDRKIFMLQELRSKVVLHVSSEDMSWCRMAQMFNVEGAINGDRSTEPTKPTPKPRLEAKNLVYQMYTSGSTGRPKAVSLEHGNAIATVVASKELVPWNPKSRMLQYAAPSFDMCYYDTFLAWYLGICLCSAADNEVFNDLPGVINTLQVTMLGLTPSVALTLHPEKIPGIQWMYCIGEAMPQSLVDTWHGKLVNSYGPTEAAQMVTIFPVDQQAKSAVIGRPFPSTSFCILQKDTGDVLPTFGIGELCIGGQQIAREYFANEEKTKQSFIVKNEQRLYRTGDNVRLLGNGLFEFVGRTDDQVKIRGQRVELGEINKAIQDSSAVVKSASSQIMKVSDGSKDQLVSFVVLEEDARVDHEELREQTISHLQSHLPSYMVPKMILFLERIPLSSAGKVDKRALKTILQQCVVSQDGQSSNTDSARISPTELRVRSIFAQFSQLQPDEVGLDVSIYRIGLDSVSAIQMAAVLKQEGFAVDASDILSRSTVIQLAALLDERRGPSPAQDPISNFDFIAFDNRHRSAVAKSCSVSEKTIAAIRPATSLQSGMISQSMHSHGKQYFNHMTYSYSEGVDKAKLANAWRIVAAKYEILRSGFSQIDDARIPFALITYHDSQVDLSIEIQESDAALSISQKADFSQRAVDNLQHPPWRVTLQPTQMHFSAHHALYDAQVLDLILRDVATSLDDTVLRPAPSFEAQVERSLVAVENDSPAAKFWTTVGEKSFVTRFPILTPLKVVGQDLGEIRFTCSASRSKLENGCRQLGITMQAAGQAAWGRLLSAYIGEHEVTFGTVLSGRATNDADEIGFPCITTVPTPVNASKSKADLFKDLMIYNADVQRHQFVPLKHIERITGHPNEALFDTIFTYQKRPAGLSQDSVFKFVENDLSIDYPLSVELEPVGDYGLVISLYYRLSRVPQEQAQLMAEQLNELLMDTLASEQDWTPPSIHKASQRLYSVTAPEFPNLMHEAKALHDFVDISTRKDPNKVALEFVFDIQDSGHIERKTWTYEQLDHESNRVANILRIRGVTQGTIVAVCFDKCPEAAFAMLAISKLGCSFLALDAGAPFERKKFIMGDSKATALVTKGMVAEGLENVIDVPIINFDQIDMTTIASDPVKLHRLIDPQDLSYCLYTSGTTGTPKGCAITHENVVQAFLSFHKLYRWNDESRWLQFASYHFDVSVMEHFWSWSVGMTVVVASRDLVFADLSGTIKKLEITHTDLTPSLARLLDPEDVPSLAGGVFVTGGEMLRQEVIDKFGPHGAIYNAYGPTEATIGCTMYPGVPKDGRPSNIGWHFPAAGSIIVNPQDPTQPVLRGAVGEFVVTGKLVAQGYIGRPDLTKERFIVLNGERCYRTGDLVRILHNNTFDFVGRADDQVKLRGQRLEIGEINSVIKARDDAVIDVTTQVLKHPKQQKEQLVSFVVSSKSKANDREPSQIVVNDPPRSLLSDLRRACQEKLPQYMVPTHILPINKLPLSANNKADAKQLKALYENTSVITLQMLSHTEDSNDARESSAEQKKIIRVLSKSLDLASEQISADVSFFELGLDSISIIGFAKSLRNNGLPHASTATIMNNSTPSRLAAALAGKDGSMQQDGPIQAAKQNILACQHRYKGLVAAALSVTQAQIDTLAPCTPLQQGIISRALKSGNEMYYGTFHFRVNRDVDFKHLRQAFQKVVDHVQILRTRFISTDDGYVQAVLKSVQLPWLEHQIRTEEINSHLKSRHEAWRQHNSELIDRPVEVLLTRSEQGVILSLHIFHACYDGNSLPLLVQSLLGEYHNAQNVKYGPAFHNALAYGPLRELKGAKQFWIEHLRPAEELGAQAFSALTSEPSEQSLSVPWTIDAIEGLERCRRQLNVTPQALLQACWGSILQEEVSRPLVQGMVVSGRSIDFEGANETVGPLFNTIPFLLQLNQGDSWQIAVQRCHDFNTAALPFQHTPLRDIQKWTTWLQMGRERSLFDALFVFQKETPGVAYPAIWEFDSDHFEADYLLALEVEHTRYDSFNLTLVTQAGISNQSTSERLLVKLQTTLQQLVADPGVPISDSISVHEIPQRRQGSSTNNGHAHTNGHSHVNGNGHANGKTPQANGFQWSPAALQLRAEVAGLAGVDAEQLSHDTSILELGLDSVDAVKLSSRMKSKAGIKISVSTIMRLLTVGKIATFERQDTQSSQADQGGDKYGDLKAQLTHFTQRSELGLSDAAEVHPSTPLQEGMVADMINSEFRQYFNHDVVKLKSGVDLETLKSAWQRVVDSSPILRTSFVDVDDPSIDCTVAQVVQAPQALVWRRATITKDDDIDSILEKIRVEAYSEALTKPCLKLTILDHANDSIQQYLILSISHAMYDGWSLSLLHADVLNAYQRSFEQRRSYEPALRKIVDSAGHASEAYWRDTLHDTTASVFHPRAENESSLTTHRHEIQCQQSADDIQEFCKTERTTLAAFSQAVWSLVLASRLQQLDVAYTMVLSGRDGEETNDVLFPTMNTVIARSVIHGSRAEMMHYIQSNLTAVSEYQHFPLRKALALAKKRSEGDLVNSLFIYQRRPDVEDTTLETLYDSVQDSADEGIPVAVEAEVANGKLTWRIAAKDDYLSDDQTQSILQDLTSVTSEMIERPHADAAFFEDNDVAICGLPKFRIAPNVAPSDEQAGEKAEQDDTTEMTEIEAQVQSVVALVARLEASEVKKNSSLLSLGLDSISAIKVSALLRRQGISITVNDLLKEETISKIAERVEQLKTQHTNINGVKELNGTSGGQRKLRDAMEALRAVALQDSKFPPSEIADILPATSGQTLMLSKWQNQGLYLPSLNFSIAGTEDTNAVCEAWTQLVAQIPILRTAFVATGNNNTPIVQVILKASHKPATSIPISQSFESLILEREGKDAQRVTPAALFAQSTGEGKINVVVRLSHALYDGYSIKFILDRLQSLLRRNDISQSAPAYYLDHLDSIIVGRRERKEFWTSYLSNLKVATIPHPNTKSSKRFHVIKPNVVSKVSILHSFARQHGLTVQSIFLAVYAQIYARLANAGPDRDVLLGAYVANRNFEGADEVDAPTLGFVPVRVKAGDRDDLITSAKQIQLDLRELAQDTRGSVSLQELQEWLGVDFKVDTWVNLILEDEGSRAAKDKPSITFGEQRSAKNETHDVASKTEDQKHGLFLRNNKVQRLYQDSVDVDGTISANSMDIGILAPDGLVDQEGVENIITDLSWNLSQLTAEA